MAFEVDEIVGIVAAVSLGEHFLEPGQGRRTDEIEGRVVAERFEGVEERGGGEARVYEAEVGGPADDQEDAERELGGAVGGDGGVLKLAADADALETERAGRVGEQFPWEAEDG